MTEDVVRTRRLEVVDHEDRPRIVAEVAGDGSAIVAVSDAYGRSRARIHVEAEGVSMICVNHPTNDLVVYLGSQGDSGGVNIVRGLESDRTIRASLSLGDERAASLVIGDKDGQPRVLLKVDEDGTTTIEPSSNDEVDY
jgi:hypothetical protein